MQIAITALHRRLDSGPLETFDFKDRASAKRWVLDHSSDYDDFQLYIEGELLMTDHPETLIYVLTESEELEAEQAADLEDFEHDPNQA